MFRIILAAVFLICDILGLYYGYDYLNQNDISNIHSVIENVERDVLKNINDTFNVMSYNVRRNNAILRMHSKYISNGDFEQYIQYEYLPIKEYINLFLWTPKIYQNETTEYNAFCNNSVFKGCYLSEINKTSIIPVLPRDTYYPATNAVPAVANILIGFDMMSYPSTAVFIQNALASADMVISEKIRIANVGGTNNYGFIVAMQNPNGVMMCILNINKMITTSLNTLVGTSFRNNVDIFIFDTTTNNTNMSLIYKENKKIYENINISSDVIRNDFTTSNNLKLINKNLLMYIVYLPSFIDKYKTILPFTITLCASIIMVCLNILIYVFMSNYIKNKHNAIVATQMLGYVNHEIRNPLNGIYGLVDLTLESITDTRKKQQFNSIFTFGKDELCAIESNLHTANRSCILLKHIVNDVLDIRKLEEGKVTLDNHKVSLHHVTIQIGRIIKPKLQENQNITYECNIDEKLLNKSVLIDDHRLTQILLNLLTNAIKFTTKGSVTLKIEYNNRQIIFYVIDTGRGIDAKYRQHLFTQFTQEKREDSTRYGGIGLGLYLCKMLTGVMGGKIGCTSEVGKGSTFWVSFPTDLYPVEV